jgi:hypothetical protein
LPAPERRPAGPAREDKLSAPVDDAAELAGYRSLWDAPEVEFSPTLRFLSRRATQPAPSVQLAGR